MLDFDAHALGRALFEELDLPPRGEITLAYSGGRDSQVLLHALCALRREHGFPLSALHFDHGLDPESAHWARRCAATCREWEVTFLTHREAVVGAKGESIEALARQRRYRWFAEVVAPGQVLLTAHHADDQAETVLLNLLRGGGLSALAGIPPRRRLSAKKSTRVIRPLLAFSGTALADYARRHGLSWMEDPSNQSLQFDRNYLRQTVLPLLGKRWPGVATSLGSSAAHCREAAGFIDQVMEPLRERCEAAGKRGVFCVAPPLDVGMLKTPRASELSELPELSALPEPPEPPDRFQIITLIRHWLHHHGHRSPSWGQLTTLYRQVFAAGKARAGVRWDGVELRYFNGHLHLIRRLDNPSGGDAPLPDALPWDLRPRNLANGLRLEIREGATPGLAPGRLRDKALKLVWRKGGERMTLPGRGHSSALKKLFQENAVPPWERRALPLLVADDQVAWAHGVGPGAACCAQGKSGIALRFVAEGDTSS